MDGWIAWLVGWLGEGTFSGFVVNDYGHGHGHGHGYSRGVPEFGHGTSVQLSQEDWMDRMGWDGMVSSNPPYQCYYLMREEEEMMRR